MEVGSLVLWREAVNCWRLALSEADDLAVGRGTKRVTSSLVFQRRVGVGIRRLRPKVIILETNATVRFTSLVVGKAAGLTPILFT